MALIKCTECGKEISDKASCCPKCGCPVVVHKWRCSKCGNTISKEPCTYCSNAQSAENTNFESCKNDSTKNLEESENSKGNSVTSKHNKSKKIWIILGVIAAILIGGVILWISLSYTGVLSDNKNKESDIVDMGTIGNKITIDGTVAYVAEENKVLVPYDFYGDFNECRDAAYSKSLKGCENPQLPADETEDLPEEVAREIISFYGDIGGFWTSIEAAHANMEFADAEPESLHYAGIIDSYFSTGNDDVATLVWGYCLSSTNDETTMGLLVLYDVIADEFEFTDVEDTADPNYSTEPLDLYESVIETNDDNLDVTQQNTFSQQINAQKNDEDIGFDVDAKILDNGQVVIHDGWIYFRGSLGLCRMKTDGSNKQSIIKGNPLNIKVKDDWVYYCDDNISLYRIKTDGSNKQILYDDDPGEFIIDQDWIFCSNVCDCEIFRIKTDGSNKQKIIDWLCHEQLAVADNWLYFEGLCRVKTDGTDLQQIDTSTAYDITVIDDWVYYRGDYTISRVRTDGSQKQQLSDDDIRAFVIIEDWIYYSNKSDGYKIYRMKTDGTENHMLIDEAVSDLWADGDWIFYTSSIIGDLFRIKTDGSQKQLICQSY